MHVRRASDGIAGFGHPAALSTTSSSVTSTGAEDGGKDLEEATSHSRECTFGSIFKPRVDDETAASSDSEEEEFVYGTFPS